jgi:CRISPR system Cascade subunit CasE
MELYLSKLTLNPLQSQTVRLLGDTYRLHQWILTAFPHREEGGVGRVLFRSDTERRTGKVVILVQSNIEPDWSHLSQPYPVEIEGPKCWKPNLVNGQQLRFRLRANTMKRSATTGKRIALLTRKEQADWLARKGQEHGFRLVPVPTGEDWLDPFGEEPEARDEIRITKLDLLSGHKGKEQLQHFGVDFEGVLTVTDPVLFAEALAAGIGAAKGFGFGLLSVARA